MGALSLPPRKGTHGREMARYRLTTIVVLLALALACALAPGAMASSTLLSGYGGPGQGNQAILGTTLIGGGSAGGSGGGSSGTGAPPGTAASLELEEGRGGSSGAGGASGAGGSPRTGSSASQGAQSAGSAGAGHVPAALAAARVDAPALGLSGGDLAYVVLGFLVLALTALLSFVLMRRAGAERPAGER